MVIISQSLDNRIERGRPEEFPGNATGGVFLRGVPHRLGIGPRIDEPGIGRTASCTPQNHKKFPDCRMDRHTGALGYWWHGTSGTAKCGGGGR